MIQVIVLYIILLIVVLEDIINILARFKERKRLVAKKIFNNFLSILSDKQITFVQVGAFDGVTGDPLYEYVVGNKQWKGVLLEPIKEYYDMLCSNYSCRRDLVLVNKAIDSEERERDFYYIETNDEIPESLSWYKQLGSFNKSIIDKTCVTFPAFKKHIRTKKIYTTTFKKIFEENNISKVDLLQIDTEGSDFDVLELFLNEKPDPAIIHLEYKHLKSFTYIKLCWLLFVRGYSYIKDANDITAVKSSFFSRRDFMKLYLRIFFTRFR